MFAVGDVDDGRGTVRVVVADDDPLVRAGLESLLTPATGVTIVASAADGAGAVQATRVHQPDVVLVDRVMPETDGVWAVSRLRQEYPKLPIVVMTTMFDREGILQVVRAGATGCLLKHEPGPQLVAALRSVAFGTMQFSPDAFAGLLAQVSTDSGASAALADVDALNERELMVALAVTRGLTNAEIAAEAYLSVATVKSCITRILTRFGVDNRVQIAIRVHDAGLG